MDVLGGESGCRADTISYTIVINAYVEAHDLEGVDKALGLMRMDGWVDYADTSLYNKVIKACAEARDVARAEQLLYKKFVAEETTQDRKHNNT